MLPKNADKIFYDNFSSNTFERKNQFHSFLCLRPQILWSCFSCNNRNWWEKKITYYMSSMNHAFFPQGRQFLFFFLQFAYILYINFNFKIYQQLYASIQIIMWFYIADWSDEFNCWIFFRSYKVLHFWNRFILIVMVYYFLMHCWMWLDNIMLLIFRTMLWIFILYLAL